MTVTYFSAHRRLGRKSDRRENNSHPCAQRTLHPFCVVFHACKKGVDGRIREMLEQCMTTCGKGSGIKAKRRSRARKEASAKEVRGYFKQFAEAKHLEYKSWVDNEVSDLVDLRKVKQRNYVTGGWVLTIKTDKQGNFLMAKPRWVLRGLQDKQKEYQQTDSFASTRRGFRMSCQMAASKRWNMFHIDLKTAFLQGQSFLLCESWCCVSNSTRSRSSSLHCCKIEETCLWHEWCA